MGVTLLNAARVGRRLLPWFVASPYIWQAVIVFGLNFLVAWHKLDPDFGWHLSAGNYFLAHGIPSHDIFTYTAANFRWIDHEWGNDVIVALFYSVGGYLALAFLYAGLWTAALLVTDYKAHWLAQFFAVIALLTFAGIRPIVWTALFLALLLWLMRQNERRWYWLIPPLFLVWVNLHGGFAVGLAILAYFAIHRRRWKLAMLWLVSAGLTLINPYGWHIYQEIARTMLDRQLHNQINEWQSFTLPGFTLPFLMLWSAGFLVALSKYRPIWRGWRIFADLPFIMLLAALSAMRNVPLFIIAALRPAGNSVQPLTAFVTQRLSRRQITTFIYLAFLPALLLFYAFGSQVNDWLRQSPYLGYPVAQVAYLRKHPCNGNLFNEYNYGGYLIWKLPRQKVYIDGRMPSWRDQSGQKYMDIYLNVAEHPAKYYPTEFHRYNIRCVLIDKYGTAQPLYRLLKKEGWQTKFENYDGVLMLAPQ